MRMYLHVYITIHTHTHTVVSLMIIYLFFFFKPLYGLLQAKLQLITHAYFEEKDFSQISILKVTTLYSVFG